MKAIQSSETCDCVVALHNPYKVWTMAFVELTTGEVKLMVVVIYLIGMEGNYSPSPLLTHPILANKLPPKF